MNISIKCIVSVVLVIGVVLFFLSVVRMYVLLQRGKFLAKNALAFERVNPESPMKILVLGDSTAVGTGAEDPTLSTAGRLGTLYPQASIKNASKNGLKLQGLLSVVDDIDPSEHFSIILVQIGANDIMRLTQMADIKRDAEQVLARLSKQTDNLIVLHSGDIGKSHFFPIYVRSLLTKRSYAVRDIYRELASKYQVHYVDLIGASSDALLNQSTDTYYASDRLHLTGAGYGLWFAEIEKFL